MIRNISTQIEKAQQIAIPVIDIRRVNPDIAQTENIESFVEENILITPEENAAVNAIIDTKPTTVKSVSKYTKTTKIFFGLVVLVIIYFTVIK